MAHARTCGEMLQAVRDNLGERHPAFWLADRLMRHLPRAAGAVYTECRKVKADYHQIDRDATQGVVTIFGDTYDCANLTYLPPTPTAVGDFVALPYDLLELTLVECITPSYEWVTFDLSKP